MAGTFLHRLALLILLGIALPAMSVAQDEKPASVAPATLLAEALNAYRSGNFEEALAKYNQVLTIEPSSGDAHSGLVRVYLKQDKVEEADAAAKRGITANPTSTATQTAQGEVYFRKGDIAAAEQQFVKVINTGELNARAYLGLARIRSAISMHKKAKDLIDRAHAFDPSDPDIQRYWMATLKRPERIKMLEAYLAGPTNDDSDDRDSMKKYLELMKNREQNPNRKCKLVNKVPSTQTDLVPIMIDATHLHGYGLNVKFNDRNARLLLDTGASGITVKKSIAEKAGITKIVQTTIGGIGDKKDADAYIGLAESIQVGNLTFQNCMIAVTEKSIGPTMDGLIGSDVFADYLVGIDFTSQKLKLGELPKRPNESPATVASLNSVGTENENDGIAGPQDRYIAPEMQNYTKIFRFGHDLLIPTKVGDSASKLFLIDTGATTNGISPAAAKEVTKIHFEPGIQIKGMSGKVDKVFTADKAVLQFSRYRQENQEMISWDFSKLSRYTGVEVSGFLGFVTLRMFELKIDYRDGLVDFDFNNKLVYGK
jgi:tetratricopeptide (TPR) repeat protein